MGNTSQETPEVYSKKSKTPIILWGLIVVLLLLLGWQQFKLHRGDHQMAEDESTGSVVATSGPRSSADIEWLQDGAMSELEQEALKVKALSPELTGQRMFEELKYVVGEDQEVLSKLTERMILEGRLRRELENKAAQREISESVLRAGLLQLSIESETFAQALLDADQFNRYRDVRQSWRRGRAHPDLNQEE